MLPEMNLAHSLAYRLSSWNRARKWEHFLSTLQPTPATRVLDVGFQDKSFQQGDSYIEENHPWRSRLTAPGIVEPDQVVVYDGRDFPSANETSDIVWSNALVEHVGDREAQIHFLAEAGLEGARVKRNQILGLTLDFVVVK